MSKLNDKLGDDQLEDGKVEEECPFCTLRIVVDAKACTITHARPTCAKYDAMSADDYIVEVHRKVQHDILTGELGPLKVLKRGSA